MGKSLIIAEKPNLGRNVANGIPENFNKFDGYLESSNYIVTWGFGHLFGLLDVEEYQVDYDPKVNYSWKMESLPFYPDKFKFGLKKNGKKIDQSAKKQFGIIKKLIHRKDVTNIIHCGDADREGEIIVRLILEHAGNCKPVKRLWEDDQTPATLYKGLQRMIDDFEKDAYAAEGYARTFIDWLYGINLTRYITLSCGKCMPVGRVLTAIVQIIYERDQKIKEFSPETYYGVAAKINLNGTECELISKRTFFQEEDTLAIAKKRAEEWAECLNDTDVIVSKQIENKKIQRAGKLFSQTSLQNAMSKKYKMSPKDTLRFAQELYEKGYISYPRTSSEYLASGEKENIQTIVRKFKEREYDVVFKDDKSIFNDAKIVSHGALIPTKEFPNTEQLPDGQKEVYEAIKYRFLAVFCKEDMIINEVEIHFQAGTEEEFTIKGSVLITKGWTKYEQIEKKDRLLPNLTEGERLNGIFRVMEKETTPPKHYTVETLNSFLQNPFKEDKKTEEDDISSILNGLEIGTSATRAGIIDNAIRYKYIKLDKDKYSIQPDGEYLCQLLTKLGISMDKNKTAEIGKSLKAVSRNEISIEKCVKAAEQQISEYISNKMIHTNSIISEKQGQRVYLNPKKTYSDREKIKKLGGRFDIAQKLWYVPEGIPQKKFQKWI